MKIRVCSFCGYNIQPGEGITYVKNDGTIWDFCTKKCRLAKISKKKNPRRTRWTKYYGQQ